MKEVTFLFSEDGLTPSLYKTFHSTLIKEQHNVERKYKEEINKLTEEKEEKLTKLQISIDEIANIFHQFYIACPECNGTGSLKDYDSMYDDRGHSVKCEKCNGVGYFKKH